MKRFFELALGQRADDEQRADQERRRPGDTEREGVGPVPAKRQVDRLGMILQCGYCVVRLPEIEKNPKRFSEYMIGNCLPCSLSPRFE